MGRQGTPRTDAPRASLARRLSAYVSAHRQRRRWFALVGVLEAVVVVVTAGALTMPASTMTADSQPEASAEVTQSVEGAPEDETTSEDAVDAEQVVEDTTAQASTETPATLPEGAQVPDGYTQSYTATDEQNGVVVTVYAPEGVVPEGATLKTQLLDQNGDEYAAAKQAAGVTDDEGTGFAAMDISFVDADGNEVEPNGDVYVTIDAAGILSDDADPESVTVQHLAEDENGTVVSADAVADAADATDGVAAVAADDTTAVQAAFTTDSFSTFTITWSNGYWKYFNVTVHYVDENGTEIVGSRSANDSISNNVTRNFSEYAGSIDGYTYQEAHYGSYNGRKVTSMTGSQQTGFMGYTTRYLTFKNGNSEEVATLEHGDFDLETDTADVFLVYKKNDETTTPGGTTPGGSTTTENATVQTGKTAVLRDDGNYDLTLSVSGDRGSATSPAPVDVLFIVDKSDSMNDYGRLSNTKQAMKTLVNSLEGNTNINAQYSIVTFSGPSSTGNSNKKKDASVHMGWTAVSGNNVSNSIDRITASGGTDYQAGLEVGTDQLNAAGARAGATKVVIFLSDGEPTWSYNYGNGSKALDRTFGGRNSTYMGWVETLNQAKKISCDYFYAVGIGTSANDYLDDLVTNVTATTKSQIKAESDGSNLTSLFNDIAANVSFFAAQNVMITDPLSQYADLVLTNNAPQFTVSVTNGTQTWSETVAPGESLTFYGKDGKAQTATPRVSDDNRTIYLDLPVTYQLEEGYTYSISTVITPSQTAKDAGMNSDAAKQTPDTGTGTHADKNEQGFWSNDNDNAKVTYTANGESGSENFPKPVIQVQESSLDITIKKVNDDNAPLHGAEFTLVGNDGKQYQVTANTDDSSTYSVTGLKDGTYTLTETKAPDGYQLPNEKFTFTVEKGKLQTDSTGNLEIDTETSTITVTNHSGAILPETGGSGNTPLIIGGLLLIAAAGCGYGLRRRHEGRGARS